MPCKYQLLGHTLQNKNRILMRQQGLFAMASPMPQVHMSHGDNSFVTPNKGASKLSLKPHRKRFGPLRALLTVEKTPEAVASPITLEEVHMRQLARQVHRN